MRRSRKSREKNKHTRYLMSYSFYSSSCSPTTIKALEQSKKRGTCRFIFLLFHFGSSLRESVAKLSRRLKLSVQVCFLDLDKLCLFKICFCSLSTFYCLLVLFRKVFPFVLSTYLCVISI